jgi:geranylgeranyl diphosphate synthase, type I
MDFKSLLKETAEQINIQLEDYLEKEVAEAGQVSQKLSPLVELFASQTKGGKRLRGFLTKLGFDLYADSFNPDILKISLACEIFQTAILSHDDIIDKSFLRRGVPTLYQQLGGDHYGVSQAICLGDTGFFIALRLISQTNFPDSLKLKALQSFIDTMLKTAAGQMLDVELSFNLKDATELESLQISHFKTAHYTIIGPLQLGAILAGASDQQLSQIEEFGKTLGIAYQIQDDILGIYGDAQTLGKSVTSDIEEGKPTLLYLEALKRVDLGQKQLLESIYGKKNITEEEASQIREIFTHLGSLDFAQAKAVEYTSKAKQVIPEITQDRQKRQLLEELADFLVNREK